MSALKKNQLLDQTPISPTAPSRTELSIDQIELTVFGSTIKMIRKTTLDVASELSAFIPRAEFRQRYYEQGQLISEKEIILNSITVVDAPRHPLHQGQGDSTLDREKVMEKAKKEERKVWGEKKSLREHNSGGFWRKVFKIFVR